MATPKWEDTQSITTPNWKDTAPVGNPLQANITMDEGILFNLDPDQKALVEPYIDMEEQTAKIYYDQKYGTNHTPEMLTAEIETDYGKGVTARYANKMNALPPEDYKAELVERLESFGASAIDTAGYYAEGLFKSAFTYMLGGDPKYMTMQPETLEKIAEIEANVGMPLAEYQEQAVIEGGRKLGRSIRNIKPEEWEATQQRVRQEMGEGGLNLWNQGWAGLADTAPLMLARLAGSQNLFTTSVLTMRGQMLDDLESAGVDIVDAGKAADIYGIIGGSIEFIELGGRISEAFGAKNLKKKFMKKLTSALVQAGANVGEEVAQDIAYKLIYNEVISDHNAKTGENLPLQEVLDIDGNTIKTSVGMSIVLESLGLGGRVISRRLQPKEAPFTVGDANRIRNTKTDEEINDIVESNPMVVGDDDGKALMRKMLKTPSEQTVKDFNAYKFQGVGRKKTETQNLFEDKPEEIETQPLEELSGKAEKIFKAGEKVKGIIRPFLSVTTRLKEISPQIFMAVRRVNQAATKLYSDRINMSRTFLQSAQKVIKANKDQENVIISEILNGNWDALKARGIEGVDGVRAVFQNIARDLNIQTPMQNYFRRRVKDYDGLVRSLGKEPKGIFKKALDDKRKEKGRDLTQKEKDTAIRDELDKNQGSRLKGKRTIEVVTPEMVKFYENPFSEFENYVMQVSKITTRQQLFGIKEKITDEFGEADDVSIKDNVNSIIAQMVEAGTLDGKQSKELKMLLTAELKDSPTGSATSLYKTLVSLRYVTRLKTVFAQFGDIGMAIAENGLRPVIGATKAKKWANEFGKEVKVSMEEVGVDKLDIELQKNKRNIISEFLFKPLTAADAFNKNILLQSTAEKWKTLSQTNPQKLNRILMRKFNDQEFVSKIIKDMSENKLNGDVMFAMYSQMADFHPISYSENIAMYLNTPVLRPLFVLKSFAFKRLDRLYREAYAPTVDGITKYMAGVVDKNPALRKEGARDFAYGNLKMSQFLILSIGVETLIEKVWKETLQAMGFAPEEIPEDESYVQMYLDNLSRLFPFVDPYTLKKAWERRDPFVYLEEAYDLPAPLGTGIVQSLIEKLIDGEDSVEWKKDIPWLSEFLTGYDKRKKKLKESKYYN